MDYAKLNTVLAAGHPVTGAYSLTDATAATEINAMNLAGEGTAEEVFQYMIAVKHRTGQGTDTTYTPVLGRLKHIADSAVGDNPFDRHDAVPNPIPVTLVHKHVCQAFLTILESPRSSLLDFSDTNLPLGSLNGAGVISPAQVTALETLSANTTSVAITEGLGFVSADHVTYARSL